MSDLEKEIKELEKKIEELKHKQQTKEPFSTKYEAIGYIKDHYEFLDDSDVSIDNKKGLPRRLKKTRAIKLAKHLKDKQE